jgi:hypothetical protein
MPKSWLAVLVVAVAVNAVLTWRHARAHERDQRLVLRVLLVWADTWGEPAETVRAKLREALRTRRRGDLTERRIGTAA